MPVHKFKLGELPGLFPAMLEYHKSCPAMTYTNFEIEFGNGRKLGFAIWKDRPVSPGPMDPTYHQWRYLCRELTISIGELAIEGNFEFRSLKIGGEILKPLVKMLSWYSLKAECARVI